MDTTHLAKPYRGQYRPLLVILTTATGDDLTLTLEEIAAVVRHPLAENAYVDQSYWRSVHHSHVRAWQRMGWHAWLDRQGQRVMWTRTTEVSRDR
jgi:hypothetical protein